MSITATIEANEQAIAAEPGNARVVFSTEGALTGPTHVKLTAREHAIEADEPAALTGADAHANPVEYALASLASCQAITYRFWAAKPGIQLAGLHRHPARRHAARAGAARALSRAGRRGRRALPGARPVRQPDRDRAPSGGAGMRPSCLPSPTMT